MKSLILVSSLLLLATPAFAADSDEAIDPSVVSSLEYLGHLLAPARIARGMTPKEVLTQLGSPNAKLAPSVWAYWDFKAKDAPRGDKFDAALVVFADNHVALVKLCDSKTVRAFLAQQEAKAAKNAVVAK